jgi:hypothetical protein
MAPRVPKAVGADFRIIRSHRPVNSERILELAWAMNSGQEKDRDAGSNIFFEWGCRLRSQIRRNGRPAQFSKRTADLDRIFSEIA